MSIKPNDPMWVGQKFNKLVVVGAVWNGVRWMWECSCDCGGRTVTYPNQVMRGKTKTCGCGKSVTFRDMHLKHGESGTKLYSIWKGMRNRCGSNTHSKDYGDRGISVCEEWGDYRVFKAWALSHGYEEGLTIERENVNEGYCPENCRWIPRAEQSLNTRKTILVEHDGVKAPVSVWCDQLGLKRSSVYNQIRRGVTPDVALGFMSTSRSMST
jgi:hypothetical protein